MIRFEHVSKTFSGGVQAVCDLSLEIQEGETLVLLGTSGSGKTTTMKMINRLVEPTSGRVLLEGQDVRHVDPNALRRRIGYAIQHIGLFPHMTVAENVAVVPQLLRWSRERIEQRVDRLLSMVGLTPEAFRHRHPSQLSGGQKQRVGVARALAADPPLVLMDEPFGALDPITREQLQDEFLDLQAAMQKTVVFVTHDVFEAVKVGRRIAVIDGGRLQQLAAPAELVARPANEFVDRFLGRQRFQLALLTRTVKTLLVETSEQRSPASGETALEAHDSLLAALDLFKRSGARELPVQQGGRTVAAIRREQLLEGIRSVLDETGS